MMYTDLKAVFNTTQAKKKQLRKRGIWTHLVRAMPQKDTK